MDADSTQKSLSVILDEIEERANKATEGPWRYEPGGGHAYNRIVGAKSEQTNGWPERINGIGNASYTDRICENLGDIDLPYPAANADFIASARTDVPALVKALRRAIQALELLNDGSSIYRSDISIRIELEQITAILNQGRSVGDNKGSAA